MWHPKTISLIGTLILVCACPQVSAAQMLISEAEAKLPQAQDAGMMTRGITRGPGIEQLSPTAGMASLHSPLPLRIKFTGRNNVAVDPASVKLTYLKAPPIDLTERIKSYVTKDGIEMSAAEIPPGTHVLRLEVKDAEGRSASSTITLSIAPK